MNKELYRIMFEKSGMPMAILKDGIFVKCNTAVLNCLKFKSHQSILGKRPEHLSPEFQPDGQNSALKAKQHLEQSATSCESHRFEWVHKDADGQERWFDIILTSAEESEDSVVFAIWNEITEKKMAQLELMKQNEKLNLFFSITADLIDITDLEGNFCMTNKAWKETLGYTEEELSKLTYQDLVHPDDMDAFKKKQKQLENYEPVRDFIVRLRHKNGSYRYVEWRSQRVGDLYYGADWDVTERIVAERKLRESEEKLKNLFFYMTEGVALHEIIYDDEGKPKDYRILEANPAFYKHTGIKKKIRKGITASELYNSKTPPFLHEYEAVVRTGNPYFFVTYYEPMNKYFRVSAFYYQKNCFATVFSDITKERQYQEMIYSEKEKLKTTLQSIGDGVIATDAEGNITLINQVAQKLTGWKQEDALGKPLTEVFNIINEKTRKKCSNPVEKVLKEGKTVELANHTAIISKNGSERSIADSAAPIRGKNGEIFGVVLVFRDVEEEKKKEEKIRYLSFHDKLTGLHNRAYFEEEMKRLDTARELPASVIIGDVNGLKITNDVFGHLEGDNILKKIASILKKCCRQEDIIARWGGDEFIILLPRTCQKQADNICQRIREECLKIKDKTIKPSISLGTATKNKIEEDFNAVIQAAETAMYRHKLLESKSFRSSVLSSLKKTLYERSNETEEHAERIASLCVKMGTLMDMTEVELDDLKLLSMLHDIGKIGISDSILMKPGRLTEEEWAEMKKHSEIGYRIAHATPELSQYADYILSHHERWDGSGYPQGLKGEEISLLSRIIAVADAYDVMTHDRVYSKAMSHEEAVDEIKRCSGTQFDPKVVEIFLKVVSDDNN